MRRAAALSFFLLLFWGYAAFAADIYKYRDTKGVIHYTYDLGEVPEDQRPGIKTYEEEEPATREVQPAAGQEERSAKAAGPESNPESEDAPVVDEQKIEEMNQRKKDLDQEFADLMEKKYNLLKEKERLESLAGRDSAALGAYDDKVKELNQDIADYQKRQKAFQEEADAVRKALEESQNAEP